ncbi:MAG: hypothetical protein WAT39_00235 [Planctomycetota bacterium]
MKVPPDVSGGVDNDGGLVCHAPNVSPIQEPMIPSTTKTAAILGAALLCLVPASAQAPFTIGNLVVVRVGDGSAALTNASTATFLDEYTTAGVLVQSVPLPTTVSGSNQPFTNSGTSTSEGFLNLSTNGLYLTLAGYAVPPGLGAVPATAAATTPRCVARVDLTAIIDTSTTITDAYSGATGSNANPRAAVTADGTGFWTSGTAATNGGVRYVPLGAATTTAINSGAPQNTRVVGIYNGQLYTTSSSTGYYSVCAVGTGLPTLGGAVVSVLPGLPVASGPSAYDFWFADPQTLYIADDRVPAVVPANGGGIHKYQLVGGTWTLQYVLQPVAGCRGLNGRRINGTTTLYATTAGGQLISVVDTGAGSTVNLLATAATNTAMRGVRFLPKPSTLQRLTGACGTTDIVATGTAETGTDVITTILNPIGVPFIGYGVTPNALPICGCTVLHDYTVLLSGGQSVLAIPSNPTLFGVAIYVQGLDLFAPTSCTFSPFDLFTLTDGYVFTVQ